MAGQFWANIFFPLVNTQVTIYLKRYTMHRVTPTLRGNAKAINRVATGENGGITDGQVNTCAHYIENVLIQLRFRSLLGDKIK